MENTVIEVKNLTKTYNLYANKAERLKDAIFKNGAHTNFFALNDVSFSVNEGENIGIIGKNGSGKSTLLKILTGVLTPTSGSFNVKGRVSALLELGAGFNPEYTGIENVYLNGTLMGFSKAEMDAKIDEILAFADIGAFLNQPVKTYSSGMYVRLAFAVAINVDPDILIVDEALSVGDIFFQQKCYKKFEDFRDKNKTILFVTHDLSSVLRYCNRAYLLHNGALLREGKPSEIVDGYKKIMSGIDISQNLSSDLKKPGLESLDHTDISNRNWKSFYPVNPGVLSYGDLGLEIIDFGIFDKADRLATSCLKGDTYTFRIKIKANQEAVNPIVAIAVKDVKGTEITGTNTREQNIDTGMLKPGDVITVDFTQKLTLQREQFFLSLGCTDILADGSLKIYHRLYDVIEIPMVASAQSFGYFDLESVIKVRRANA